MIDAPARLTIARSLLGEIDDKGFCRCPGQDFHTNNRKLSQYAKLGRECRVYLGQSPQNPRGVPSIKCQHTSCGGIVEDVQRKLRSEIGKHEAGKGGPIQPESPEQKAKAKAGRERVSQLQALAEKEAAEQAQTLGRYATAAMDLRQDGLPTSGIEQARALLGIFKPTDIVWTGLHAHSISTEDALDPANRLKTERIRQARPFRTAAEWIAGKQLAGPRISPSAFKGGILSRSNQFILHKRFIVIEHDQLGLDEQAAMMRWLMEGQGLRLRALIFTGGKSLHGWFDYPAGDIEEWKARLCGAHSLQTGKKIGGLAFDPASFNPSHSYRVPGWKHEKTRKPVELWRIHL